MPDRSVTYEFRGRFDSLRSGLVAAGRSVDDFGNKLTALDKNGARMRQGLTHIGSTAGTVALGAAAGLTAIIGVTANFEKAMSNVQAATGETAENMDKLRDAALQAGADTAFSASEAAAAIENLAKAGVSTEDILGGGLSGALDLAAAGQIDVATAAEQAATAMTQFGLAGKDVPHIADLLAAAAGKAQGEVTDFGQALNQAGLVADQVGLSIEETTGGLAAFASAGLLGSDAGTSFKTMLGALTPNSAKARDLMQELGISAYDAQGNFIGLSEFAGNLKDSLAGMSDEQRQATLETIFGSDAVRAASILYEQGADGIQQWIDKVNDQGFAAEQAATKMDNLSGDLEALKGSLETALIGAGSDSQGPLRKLVQTLTGVVNAFNDLPGPAKNAVTAMLGITTLLGGGLWFTSKTITGIANTKQALSDLGWTADHTGDSLKRMATTSGKLFAIAGAITAVGKAIAEATDNNLEISDLDRDLQAIANGQGGEALDQIIKSVEMVGLLGDQWQATGEAIRDSAGTVANALTLGQLGLDETGIDRAQADLEALDQTLASMVESGNVDQAFAIIDQLIFSIGQSGGDATVLLDNLKAFDTAMANYRAAADGGAAATDDLGDSEERAGDKAAGAAPKHKQLTDAMKAERDATRDAAAAFLDYSDSIVKKGKFTLDKYLDQLEAQLRAQANFDRNIATLRSRGLSEDAIDALIAEGPAAARAVDALANGTDAAIERMNRAFARGSAGVKNFGKDTESELRGAKAAFNSLPDDVRTKIKADGIPQTEADVDKLVEKYHLTEKQREALITLKDLATDRIQGVLHQLALADGKTATVTTYIDTVRRNFGSSPVGDSGNPYRADGGTVPGQRLPYGDKMLTWLAPGEEVITNRHGEADRFRADRAAGRIPAYADGGTVRTFSDYLRGQTETRSRDDEVARESRETGRALKGLKARLQEATQTVEKEKRQRDALVDKMKSLGGSVSGELMPDLFGDTNPWQSGSIFGSAVAGLHTTLGNQNQMERAIRELRSKGLTGPALAYVLAEGGLAGALAFAEQPASELREFAQLYNRSARNAREIGQLAGRAAYGPQLALENKELREANRRLDAIEKALHRGNRDRKEEHGKDRQSQRRGAGNGQRNRRRD